MSVTSDQSDERSCGAERDEDGLRDEQRVLDRGERREPDAVGKAACHLGGRADRQPRLAHPATARQRQQARGRQKPLDFMQLVASPDEAGRLDRQFRSPSLRGGGLHARPPYTPADLLLSGRSNAGSMLRNGASETSLTAWTSSRLTLAKRDSRRS